MNASPSANGEAGTSSPPTWALVLAFGLLYLSWGTTYLAIQKGVRDEQLPPALFGGVRVCLAGLVLLGFLAWRGQPVTLARGDRLAALLIGWCLFLGGNGLINMGQRTLPSGVAAVLTATVPLWIGLFAMAWPQGERLTGRGWLGLLLGLGGVLLLLAPKLHNPGSFLADLGPLLVLGSAACWALGSLLLRQRRWQTPHLTTAAYQMVLGGGSLTLLGLALGERQSLPDQITGGALGAFFYLLVVGSLVGFVTFNWLLGQVSAARVGTYAYVNPMVAVLVGWWLGGEEMTGWLLGGIVVILTGVALVRTGECHSAVDLPAAGSQQLFPEESLPQR